MDARARKGAIVLCWAIGCGGSADRSPSPTTESLPVGIAARVGDDAIALASVARIAERQHLAPAAARERAIQDALFASEARRELGGDARVHRAETAVMAAALVEQLLQQARGQGPATEAEIAQATQQRWLELDRPAAARTVHAVVLANDAGIEAAARQVADRVAVAVKDAKTATEFISRAKAVPTGAAAPRPLELRAEEVPLVTADGREVNLAAPPGRDPNRFDTTFARAANALGRAGDQSPVVRSSFGFHVIMLLERLEAHRVPLEERRRLLEGDVLAHRGAHLLEDTLGRLRAAERVEILPQAAESTAAVKTDHEP